MKKMGVSLTRGLLLLMVMWTFMFWFGLVPSFFDSFIVLKPPPPRTCMKERDPPPPPPAPFPKQLSFILLNWKRTDCVKTVVQHAQKYHSFITEIVIGNNNPNMTLIAKDFKSPMIPVRVINFPQNRFFYARYELCLMSEGLYCYFQDDDWENKHLRSLYANFLRYPHLLHTDTNSFVHYFSWMWTFFDPGINLHTGFSWVGTGAISSKENVRKFMDQTSLISLEDLPLADMYFSTWFNQVPYQLENELTELESRFGFSSESGGISRNKFHITKGIRKLYEYLMNDPKDYFTETEHDPKVEDRHTKAPCHADDCLFMTSIQSFPSARDYIYAPEQDLEFVENRHAQTFNYELFVNNPYHYAVDDNANTSWLALRNTKGDDFFGLDLLEPSKREYIYMKVGHSFQVDLSVDISHDGNKWDNETCTWEVTTKQDRSISYHRYYLTSGCHCNLRYLRFRALTSYPEQMQVYDISFTDNLDIWSSGLIPPQTPPCSDDSDDSAAIVEFDTKYREIGNEEIPVTLIILNWRRTHNFPRIFEHLAQYPYINEYIIWNNNNEMVLEEEQFFPDGPPPGVKIRIINSPQNLHDYGKYLGCSMASNDYCYFQDDDWQNVYLKSQYSNFLRFPYLFHSMTIPVIYLEHRRWNIYDEEVGLHAGFSWLGVGSFTSKERVQRFLKQLSRLNLRQDELLQADMLFSYMNNDYPVELTTRASPLDQSYAWSAGVDQWGIVYKRLGLSSTKVYSILKEGNQENLIPTQKPFPPYEKRDVRAPCNSDLCLFITNSYPFPLPENVPFDPSRTIKEQESVYNSLDWPSNWFWDHNSYERAVDGNPFTCWSSYQVASAGDYFGLDLLQNIVHQPKFTIVLTQDISKFDVAVAQFSSTWVKVSYVLEREIILAGPLRAYTIVLNYQNPYRFINFYLRESAEEILSVYEVNEGDYPGQAAVYSENKVSNPSFEEYTFANEPEANKWYVQHPAQVDLEGLQRKNTIAASGLHSLVFTSKGGASLYEARQTIFLQQYFAAPVVVTAMSKAENVVNMEYPSAGYALIVEVFFSNGKMKEVPYISIFNPGIHNWQTKVIYINEEQKIQSVTIKLLFRNHKGTVYFDDVSLQEEI